MVFNIRQICNTDNFSKQRLKFHCTTFFKRLIQRQDYYVLNRELLGQHELRLIALNIFHLIGIGLGGTIGKNLSLRSIFLIRSLFRNRNLFTEWKSSRSICWSFSDYFFRLIRYCRSLVVYIIFCNVVNDAFAWFRIYIHIRW